MNKKIVWSILSAIMFISGAVLLVYFFWANGYFAPPKTAPTEAYIDFTYPSLPSEIEVDILPTANTSIDKSGEQYEYVSPVNFDELQAANPEIIGWIYMTNPYISQPILRSSSDDSYYLEHGPTGEYDRNGSFFIEGQYNGTDFSDPCTIIYGHRQSDGSMFGNLEATYDDLDIVSDSQYIVIYLPNETKIYHVIATVPYNIKHILYYNDFYSEAGYNDFINTVYSSTGSEVQLVNEGKPVFGDRILILSTCLRTDRTQRFLVIGRELT